MRYWHIQTEQPISRFLSWLNISRSKFYDWKTRYGKVNEHNSWIPRDHWLEAHEKKAIISYYNEHMLNGYRRLTFMMSDANILHVSPSSVWRVLSGAGLLGRNNSKTSKKGTGFVQPEAPHKHWHIDVSYINISGTFYYLCSVIDGYSRSILSWDIKESMTEAEVEIILQKAKECYPDAKPRIISDNGPQFLANDFKKFIRISGMTHVRTSPFYPQSNGKIERWHKSLKKECIRPKTPLSLKHACEIVRDYIEHYNNVRLHSAIGYITPTDKLEGRAEEILALRALKLKNARENRKLRRQATREKEKLMINH